MQIVIKFIGGFLSKVLGTTKAESVSAAANIFVGQTEAPLVIHPFLNTMTKSQLFAASFMAALAGLVLAKLIMPENEQIQK